MVDRNWHNQLQRELARQGLPRLYTERLMDELFDHAMCLKEETDGMDATKTKTKDTESAAERIGKPEQLAVAAGDEYRRADVAGTSSDMDVSRRAVADAGTELDALPVGACGHWQTI